jgi:hypothetical protein
MGASYARLRDVFASASSAGRFFSAMRSALVLQEAAVRRISRAMLGVAIGTAGVLLAAGAYSEAHRAPDQP